MSGHSKWHSIKHKKGAEDAKRGKIFTKHAKLIAIAARGGGDPAMNPTLRVAIENARAENMPYDNIERAIKKGTGESKDSVQMEEIFYEGFGPGGVALYIEALTDNKNRTFGNLKVVMAKHGGNLGAAGSVGYLFKKRGLILVPSDGQNKEEASERRGHAGTVSPGSHGSQNERSGAMELIELAAIDAGAEDVQASEEIVEVYTDPGDLMKVKAALEAAKITVKSASLMFVPQTTVAVNDMEAAKKLLDLINLIEEDEDVSTVYSNFEMSDEMISKVAG